MKLKRLTLAALLAGTVGCATANVVKREEAKSAAVKETKPAAVKVVPEGEPELGAGELLEMAMTSYHFRAYGDSVDFFNRAIKTGDLNDAGQAMAYWHMSVAYNALGDTDNECEALFSFIMASEDVLEIRNKRRFATEKDGSDFVDNFGLESRLEQARTVLNAVWARRSDYFGRSEDFCIPVASKEDLEYFLRLFTKDCPEGTKADVRDLENSVHHATVKCGAETEELYFFMQSDSQAE